MLTIIADLTLDPSKSSGLDGALKSRATLPFGQIILITVGVGLICYGVYSFAKASFARISLRAACADDVNPVWAHRGQDALGTKVVQRTDRVRTTAGPICAVSWSSSSRREVSESMARKQRKYGALVIC
ncbi:DUF1206 domain-containing protein [Subtercola frigoramans]|uniref:DUF1206 domain-containing protein n=1 Tax=Subtercola frigoramans TaxID=120298 RepID=UPI003CD0787D